MCCSGSERVRTLRNSVTIQSGCSNTSDQTGEEMRSNVVYHPPKEKKKVAVTIMTMLMKEEKKKK